MVSVAMFTGDGQGFITMQLQTFLNDDDRDIEGSDSGKCLLLRGCSPYRVRNLKFATYLKFATCENTNKINELW